MSGRQRLLQRTDPLDPASGFAPAPKAEGSAIVEQASSSSSLDELEDLLNRLVAPERVIPTSRSPSFDGAFRFCGMSELGIFNVRFGRQVDVELTPEDTDDRLAFAMTASGRGQLNLGRKEFSFSGQSGVLFTSAPARTLRFMEDTENRVLLLDRRKIAEYCAKLLGREIEGHVDFDVQFSLETPQGQSWQALLQYAEDELGQPHSLVRNLPAARQQLEQMLVTVLLFGQSHNYSEALLRPQSAAVPFYVKRAEAYIEAHFAEPLSLADIAAHAGVSARSLQNGFQSFRGMTPMAFLRSVRLQHVHHALQVADPTVSTVTEIALLCGFTHLGEFATLYKRTFGVTPRQTLLKTA